MTDTEFTYNNYILRIYRYDLNNPRNLIGTAEEIGTDDKQPFHNIDELWNILNSGMCKDKQKSGKRDHTGI